MQQTCPHCRGEGEIHDPNCSICNGVGYINKNKKLSVKIPAGVDDGDRIRLTGEGELGRGGNRGDLYISINVKEHSIFEIFKKPITQEEWLKGYKQWKKQQQNVNNKRTNS